MKTKLSIVEKAVVVFYFLSPFMYLVRVIFGDSLFGFILLRAMQPLLTGVVLLALIFSKVRFDLYSSAAVLFVIYGVVAGFANGNEPFDVITGASHFLIGFLMYLYYSNTEMSEYQLIVFLKSITCWCLISISLVIAVLYMSKAILGVNIYLGLACQVLIPLSFYAIYRRSYFLFIFILSLVILSGKRGVLLAVFLGFSLSFLPLLLSSYRNFLSKLLLCILILVPFALSFGESSFDSLIQKFEYDEQKSINHYSSGRFGEVKSAMDYWQSNNARLFLGAGFGFTYTYIQENKTLADVGDYKNVHFSYLNPLIIFGFVLGVIYLLLFSIVVLLSLLKVKSKGSIKPFLKMAIVSYAIYACFAFVLFNEPLLWMLLGVLNSRRNNAENS